MEIQPRLKIGLIGCGAIARRHAQSLVNSEVADLVALCDTETEIMNRFISEYIPAVPCPRKFTDQDKLYAHSGLDGVVIATPHSLHYEHASRALSADCHV